MLSFVVIGDKSSDLDDSGNATIPLPLTRVAGNCGCFVTKKSTRVCFAFAFPSEETSDTRNFFPRKEKVNRIPHQVTELPPKRHITFEMVGYDTTADARDRASLAGIIPFYALLVVREDRDLSSV